MPTPNDFIAAYYLKRAEAEAPLLDMVSEIDRRGELLKAASQQIEVLKKRIVELETGGQPVADQTLVK